MCSSSGAHVPSSGVRSAMWAAQAAHAALYLYMRQMGLLRHAGERSDRCAGQPIHGVLVECAEQRGDVVEGGAAPRRDGVAEPT